MSAASVARSGPLARQQQNLQEGRLERCLVGAPEGRDQLLRAAGMYVRGTAQPAGYWPEHGLWEAGLRLGWRHPAFGACPTSASTASFRRPAALARLPVRNRLGRWRAGRGGGLKGMAGSPGLAGRGLPLARLLMVIGSLAPLFLLWALRGAVLSDRWSGALCLTLAVVPNLVLVWRWRLARQRNDHRVIIVGTARDQSEHLLVYLFAMLLPLYAANLTSGRELASVPAAFIS